MRVAILSFGGVYTNVAWSHSGWVFNRTPNSPSGVLWAFFFPRIGADVVLYWYVDVGFGALRKRLDISPLWTGKVLRCRMRARKLSKHRRATKTAEDIHIVVVGANYHKQLLTCR